MYIACWDMLGERAERDQTYDKPQVLGFGQLSEVISSLHPPSKYRRVQVGYFQTRIATEPQSYIDVSTWIIRDT